MATPLDELSVRITGHPEGDPEPATVTSGWIRTIDGRRDVDRPALRASLTSAAGLGQAPHVFGERYTETTWEAPGAALEIDIAVRSEVAADGLAAVIAAAVSSAVDTGAVQADLGEDEVVDLVCWQLAIVLDHHPDQIEIERLDQSEDGWSIRALTHLGVYECDLSPDRAVFFRRVPRFA